MGHLQSINLLENANHEAECLLLDPTENHKAYGLGSFLKQEFGRKLIKVNNSEKLYGDKW